MVVVQAWSVRVIMLCYFTTAVATLDEKKDLSGGISYTPGTAFHRRPPDHLRRAAALPLKYYPTFSPLEYYEPETEGGTYAPGASPPPEPQKEEDYPTPIPEYQEPQMKGRTYEPGAVFFHKWPPYYYTLSPPYFHFKYPTDPPEYYEPQMEGGTYAPGAVFYHRPPDHLRRAAALPLKYYPTFSPLEYYEPETEGGTYAPGVSPPPQPQNAEDYPTPIPEYREPQMEGGTYAPGAVFFHQWPPYYYTLSPDYFNFKYPTDPPEYYEPQMEGGTYAPGAVFHHRPPDHLRRAAALPLKYYPTFLPPEYYEPETEGGTYAPGVSPPPQPQNAEDYPTPIPEYREPQMEGGTYAPGAVFFHQWPPYYYTLPPDYFNFKYPTDPPDYYEPQMEGGTYAPGTVFHRRNLNYQDDEEDDVFTYESIEYLIVNKKRGWRSARDLCQTEYEGNLAIIDDQQKADFMAEALSETIFELETLWIAGEQTENAWYWNEGNDRKPISKDLVETFSKATEGESDNDNCLAFTRLNQDKPSYQELKCNSEKFILCERAIGDTPKYTEAIHPGWIHLGNREYRIFAEQVTFNEAESKCAEHDFGAKLAVIPNFSIAQSLGRYLLIGRPSLLNAWIGAKWMDSKYSFVSEPIDLSNTSTIDGDGPWPPWKKNEIQKKGACLLLDRHLANFSLFSEASCDRRRGYICYKTLLNVNEQEPHTDVFFGSNGYRLHYKKRPWKLAQNFCLSKYARYGSYLSEISKEEDKFQLLYLMGNNQTVIKDIWLGAQYNSEDPKGWIWEKTKSPVNLEVLDWVKNTTNDEVEPGKICLNMARENGQQALHYGKNCSTSQNFVCSFSKAKLRELRRYEKLHYK